MSNEGDSKLVSVLFFIIFLAWCAGEMEGKGGAIVVSYIVHFSSSYTYPFHILYFQYLHAMNHDNI